MLLATALALLLQDVLKADVYCLKCSGSSSTKGNYSPIISSFLNWAAETVDAAKICIKMLLKQKPSNIRKWIARFYCF